MTVALVLVGYAAVLAVAVPTALRRGSWAARAPRLGITVWLALSLSAVLAVVLAGAALAVPATQLSADLGELLRACVMALRAEYASPGGALPAATGATVTLAVLGRLVCCATAALLGAARERRAHGDALAIVGRPVHRLGAVVVDHHTAAAYCLPGRARRIVLTSAAVVALADDELSAVLAHERAHLRGRHHLVLAGVQAFDRAFPGVPLFAEVRRQVTMLVEMLADDAAARHHQRHTVAAALLRVAGARAPAAGLAAGGPTAVARVRRMLAPARPVSPAGRILVAAAVAAAVLLPVAVAAAPAAAATRLDYCPVPPPSTSVR